MGSSKRDRTRALSLLTNVSTRLGLGGRCDMGCQRYIFWYLHSLGTSRSGLPSLNRWFSVVLAEHSIPARKRQIRRLPLPHQGGVLFRMPSLQGSSGWTVSCLPQEHDDPGRRNKIDLLSQLHISYRCILSYVFASYPQEAGGHTPACATVTQGRGLVNILVLCSY